MKYSKSIKSEAVFTKIEMNNGSNINFLQNSPLVIQHTVHWVFHWSKHLWNSSFDMLYVVFPLSYFLSSNLIFEMNFQFRKQKKIAWS